MLKIILSRYVTKAAGDHNAVAVIDGLIILKIELNSLIEEVDSQTIPYIPKAEEPNKRHVKLY